LTLALGALLSLTGREADAGNLTVTFSWTGGSTSVDFTSPQAVAGGSANSFAIDPTLLNSAIAASGYQFGVLGASSNNPGDPGGAVIRLTGIAFLNGTVAPPSALTVEATQTDFTSPSGPGTLDTQAAATFDFALAGTGQTASSSVDATSTPDLNFVPTGSFQANSIGAVGNPSGYTLGTEVVITLVGAPVSATNGVSDAFSNSAAFRIVPEPSSLVLLGSGAVGLLGYTARRRPRRGA